jgi:hypothetical protein
MNVIFQYAGEEPSTVNLSELLLEDDGLHAVEGTIRATLARGEVYRDGGGAAPAFTIRAPGVGIDEARRLLRAAIAYDRHLDEDEIVAGYDDYMALLAFVQDAAEALGIHRGEF